MNVSELKAIIADLPDDMEVLYEVNGEATRTGDWFKAGAHVGFAIATTYGGFDGYKDREGVVQDDRFTKGEVFRALFIS